MKKINFLSALSDKVGKDFLHPLVLYQKKLKEHGFDVQIVYSLDEQAIDCDIFCVVSSYLRAHREDENLHSDIRHYANQASKAYFFDVNDSSGAFYTELFSDFERYYKKQMFKDKALYLKNLYSRRIVFDYYHDRHKIDDDQILEGVNITDPNDLTKLHLSWNVGLGDYVRYPKLLRPFMHKIKFFRDTSKIKVKEIDRKREIELLGCFSLYENGANTIQFHRKQVLHKIEALKRKVYVLSGFIDSNRYYASLKNSKIVVCPFGYGEISWKDYEAFVNGACVFKPDMSFMETWPNYYQPQKTYVPFAWDLSDFEEKVDYYLSHARERLDIARAAQSYFQQTISEEGAQAFCEHFSEMFK